MPRQERTKSGTGIYHVMLRGINRQDIVEDDEDYLQMIACLRGLTERYDENGVVHSQVNERLWCGNTPTVKTNRRFIWSCSEIDKMITRTDPMIILHYLCRVKHLLTIFVLLLALTCCTTEVDRNRMRAGLDSINQRNRNDQPFTAADVQSYIDFFDDYLSFKMLSASPKEG